MFCPSVVVCLHGEECARVEKAFGVFWVSAKERAAGVLCRTGKWWWARHH